jgi:NitT/TauT family transport system permease protein
MSGSLNGDRGAEGGFTAGRPSRALPRAVGIPPWKLWAGRIGIGVILFGFWEFASGRLMNTFWISKPSLIVQRLFDLAVTGKMWFHLGATMQEVLLGMLIGMAGGVFLGITLAYSGIFQHWAAPYILALFSLPKASLAPLFVIWFGIGLTSKMFMVVTMVIFVVFYNIYEGIRSIDPNLTEMMKTYRAKPVKWLQWVILPSLTTWIINCLRISIGNATVGAVIAEMIGASRGVGYYITYSSGILDTTGTFAGLTLVMILALGLGQLVGLLEKGMVKR